MSTPHRATEEQWEIVEICREQGKIPWPTATCLLELRSRIELLEATQHAHLDGPQMSESDREAMTEPGRVVAGQPEPPTLQEAQANKVHHEAELAGLEAWRRQHLIQAREVVAGQAEPEPLTTDEELYRTYMLDTGPDTVVDGLRAVYDLGRQHGAAQPAPVQSLMERVEALASGDAPVFDPLTNVTSKGVTVEGSFGQDGTTYVFKTAAQPAPAVKDSLTTAPAGSLVERLPEPSDELLEFWRQRAMAEYRDSCYEVPVSRSMALQAIAWCRQQLQPGAVEVVG
jgi:hypothetical protein